MQKKGQVQTELRVHSGVCVSSLCCLPGQEGLWQDVWLVLMPRGGWFLSNHPSELLNSFLRSVQIAPKESDQSRLLGGFKLNSKWHGIINNTILASTVFLLSGLTVKFRAPSISPLPQHSREQEPPCPPSLIPSPGSPVATGPLER